jgi:hypothetical protein
MSPLDPKLLLLSIVITTILLALTAIVVPLVIRLI